VGAKDFHSSMVLYSHSPAAKAFDFDMLILAPDTAPYWSMIVRILEISLGDVTNIVTSLA
jgi:hypothetical protein